MDDTDIIPATAGHWNWRLHAKHLYGFITNSSFPHAPVCTIDWFQHTEPSHVGHHKQHIALGSRCVGSHHSSSITVAQALLPDEVGLRLDTRQQLITQHRREDHDYVVSRNVRRTLSHDGIMERIRVNSSGTLAAVQGAGQMSVYLVEGPPADAPSDSSGSGSDRGDAPACRLSEQAASSGRALEWNPGNERKLLAGGGHGDVCICDVEGCPPASKQDAGAAEGGVTIEAEAWYQIRGATACMIQDAGWRPCGYILGAVAGGQGVHVWDRRKGGGEVSCAASLGRRCLSVSFNCDGTLVAAGCASDGTKRAGEILIWDFRMMSVPSEIIVCTGMQQHDISQVAFHPRQPCVFASAALGQATSVAVWDLRPTGHDTLRPKLERFPPELAFIHGGHFNPVLDFRWNPSRSCCMASVCSSMLQVWEPCHQVSRAMYEPEPPRYQGQASPGIPENGS